MGYELSVKSFRFKESCREMILTVPIFYKTSLPFQKEGIRNDSQRKKSGTN